MNRYLLAVINPRDKGASDYSAFFESLKKANPEKIVQSSGFLGSIRSNFRFRGGVGAERFGDRFELATKKDFLIIKNTKKPEEVDISYFTKTIGSCLVQIPDKAVVQARLLTNKTTFLGLPDGYEYKDFSWELDFENAMSFYKFVTKRFPSPAAFFPVAYAKYSEQELRELFKEATKYAAELAIGIMDADYQFTLQADQSNPFTVDMNQLISSFHRYHSDKVTGL